MNEEWNFELQLYIIHYQLYIKPLHPQPLNRTKAHRPFTLACEALPPRGLERGYWGAGRNKRTETRLLFLVPQDY